MKLVLLFGLVFVGAVCASEFGTPDELSYYGLDESDGAESSEEAVEVQSEVSPTPEQSVTPFARRGRHQGRHQGRHHGRHHGHHNRQWGERETWTPEEKLSRICSHLNSSNGGMEQKLRRKFSRMEPEARERMIEMMQGRKAAMVQCCQMSGDEKLQCAENLRTQRYERVCSGEEALCPWAAASPGSAKAASIAQLVERCCQSQGQERVTCFTEARTQYHGRHHRRE